MKTLMAILMGIIVHTQVQSQTRAHLNVGTNISTTYFVEGFYRLGVGSRIYVTDTEYSSGRMGTYWNAELTIETRLNKLLYGVSGLSYLQAGYHNSQDNFFSDLSIGYLGIPLLLRANFANSAHLDIGFIGLYPLNATLNETRNQGTQFQLSASENIASHLTTFNLAGYLQASILINRFTLSAYLISGSSRVDQAFKDEWVIGNGSLFLRDVYPKFKFQMTGIKIGMRIR
ncbi:MAG: hypothetical protein RIG77_09830 [Cyclobacteriaceae bacterium]